MVSAFIGGRRWLVLPALDPRDPARLRGRGRHRLDGGVGDRDYRPTTVARAARRLRARRRRAAPRPARGRPARRPDAAGARHGHRQRRACSCPDDVCVASDVRVGAGYARVLDRDSGGSRRRLAPQPGERGGVKRLVIDGDVGIGELQVVHGCPSFDSFDQHGFDRDDRFDLRPRQRAGRTGPARARPQRGVHGGRVTPRDFDPASLVAGLVVCGLGVLLLLDQVDASTSASATCGPRCSARSARSCWRSASTGRRR